MFFIDSYTFICKSMRSLFMIISFSKNRILLFHFFNNLFKYRRIVASCAMNEDIRFLLHVIRMLRQFWLVCQTALNIFSHCVESSLFLHSEVIVLHFFSIRRMGNILVTSYSNALEFRRSQGHLYCTAVMNCFNYLLVKYTFLVNQQIKISAMIKTQLIVAINC